MYCKSCGNFLPDNAKYCPVCGKINESVVSEENVKNAEYDYLNDIVVPTGAETAPEDPQKSEDAGSILKFAILGLAFGCTGLLSLLGLIFSYIARGKIKRFVEKYGETSGKASVGKGLSIGGVIVSWFMLVFIVIYIALIVLTIIGTVSGGSFPAPGDLPGVTF